MSEPLKCVLVGDTAVGKTVLIKTFQKKEYSKGDDATVLEKVEMKFKDKKHKTVMEIYDTAGSEDYDRLRPQAYKGADVFIICFSLIHPSSLRNAKHKWVKEIKGYNPDVPYILAGLRMDERDNFDSIDKSHKQENMSPIKKSKGQKAADKIEALSYTEVSAKNQQRLDDLFNDALARARKYRASITSGCCYIA